MSWGCLQVPGLFLPDTWDPCKWNTKQRAQGSLFSPCFCGLLSLDICQHCAITALPIQGQFPCLPRSLKQLQGQKAQPLLYDHHRGEASPSPASLSMTKADSASASFAAQPWHTTSADASWSATSDPSQHEQSQGSCTPALGHSLGVTPVCITAFALK